MDRLKRLVSFRSSEQQRPTPVAATATPSRAEMGQLHPPRVQFHLGEDTMSNTSQDSAFRSLATQMLTRRPAARTNLQRTRSRSVDCMKGVGGPGQGRQQLLRKSILKAQKEDSGGSSVVSMEQQDGGRSQTPPGRSTRSQSYYSFRPRNLDSPAHSTGNLRASIKARPGYHDSASMRLGRCGSTPPTGRGSLSSIRGAANTDAAVVAETLKSPQVNPRLQSEENLMMDLQRKHEATWLNNAKRREESTVLTNIKKREMIEMKKKEPLTLPKIREEEKVFFVRRDLSIPKNIAAGLLSMRDILLAPTAAALIIPTSAVQNAGVSEREKLEKWVPPPQQKPKERNIVRKVVAANLSLPKEPPGTDFLGSPFNQEALEWHNMYRLKHSALPLQLDANLCASAQYWANILAQADEFRHQNPPNIGESLLAWPLPVLPETALISRSQDFSGKDLSSCWYKTQRNYYFRKSPEVLHIYGCQFSQMVWQSSKYVGFGKARSRSGKILIVGHYFPRGNIAGEYHYNVLPSAESFGVEGMSNNTTSDFGSISSYSMAAP